MLMISRSLSAKVRSTTTMLLRRAVRQGRLRLGNRGATIVFVAAAIPAFVVSAALAIDVGYLYYVKNRLQTIADAAALAGSSQFPNTTSAITTASSYAGQNTPSSWGSVVACSNIVPGTWDSTSRKFTQDPNWKSTSCTSTTTTNTALQVTATYNVNLFFASAINWHSITVQRQATATYGTDKAWDVTLVQDISQSMSKNLSTAITADESLLGCQTDATSSASQFGLVAQTGHYETWTPNGWKQSAQMTNSGSLNSSSTNSAKNPFKNLGQCGDSGMPACSGSNFAAGLYGAYQNFTSSSYTPSSNLTGQAVILVTDGQPNADSIAYTTADGMPSGYNQSSGSGRNKTTCKAGSTQCTDTDLVNWAETQAGTLGTAGIQLFIVYYTGDDGASGLTNVQAIANANKDSKGNILGKVYTTATIGQLESTVGNVCSSLPHALVN